MAQAMATSHPGLTEPSPATEEMGDWITTAHRNVFISQYNIKYYNIYNLYIYYIIVFSLELLHTFSRSS